MAVASPTYDNLRVQYFDGAAWQDFGPVRRLSSLAASLRFAGEQAVTARRFRIVAQDRGGAAGTISGGAVSAYQETAALSEAMHIPFAFNSTQYYSFWLSDKNARIFYQGYLLADVAIPHSSTDLIEATYAQSLDTLIIYHKNHPPWRILRQGYHNAWDSRPVVYENKPIFDYDGTAIGGINAQQQIRFSNYADGDKFTLNLAGETTTTLTYTELGVADAVYNGLGALKNVDSVGLSALYTQTGSDAGPPATTSGIVTVNFTGNNGNREWPEMFGTSIDTETGGIVVSTLVRGKAGGEDIMSDLRGWPRTGTFFQQRQFLGGFRSRPSTFGASVIGDYFNLNIDLESPDVGLDITLDGADVVEIRHMIPGRHLTIFTASAEYYIPNSPIVRDTITVNQTSAVGCRVGIRPIVIDGPVLFIERRSGALRAFVYSEGEQSYVPEVISMHASHLLTNPVDMARRPSRTAKEADLIVIPNQTGEAAALTLLRSHDIVAFTRFSTPNGQILAVGVENELSVELMIERGGERYLEYMWDGGYLDSAQVFDAVDQAVFDAAHLTGEVAVMVDGAFHARADVAAGTVTLDAPVSGVVEIGYEPHVGFETLPVRRLSEEGGYTKSRLRIVRANFNVEICTAFDVAVNDEKFYSYRPELRRNVLDAPRPLFEEQIVETQGFPGASFRPHLTFKQAVPGPMHIRSLDMETSE